MNSDISVKSDSDRTSATGHDPWVTASLMGHFTENVYFQRGNHSWPFPCSNSIQD